MNDQHNLSEASYQNKLQSILNQTTTRLIELKILISKISLESGLAKKKLELEHAKEGLNHIDSYHKAKEMLFYRNKISEIEKDIIQLKDESKLMFNTENVTFDYQP